MCTSTYIPRPNKSYILSSNRDEAPSRAATEISSVVVNDRKVYFPKDQKKGGSWMAIDNEGRSVCLLNGADKKHASGGTYRRSRGLMLLDYFSFKDYVNFIEDYNFKGIEPFTLIMAQQLNLSVLKWNGQQKKVQILDPYKAYIWASATLYDETSRSNRNAWFDTWKKEENFSKESIINFHKLEGTDGQEGMLIDRNGVVKTLSITSIEKKESYSILEHHDLLERKIKRIVVG